MEGYGIFAIYLAVLALVILYEWVKHYLQMRSEARRDVPGQGREEASSVIQTAVLEALRKRVYPSPFEWTPMLPEPTVGDPADWQAWTEEMQG